MKAKHSPYQPIKRYFKMQDHLCLLEPAKIQSNKIQPIYYKIHLTFMCPTNASLPVLLNRDFIWRTELVVKIFVGNLTFLTLFPTFETTLFFPKIFVFPINGINKFYLSIVVTERQHQKLAPQRVRLGLHGKGRN